VLAFSDGLFAIAMTLLVVAITVPTIQSAGDISELADALGDQESTYISFFLSFVVIGRYWVAHHQFFSLLGGLDLALLWINLIYLAFIAFLPFPTDLLGTYFANPLSVVLYSANVAVISGLEVVLFRHAHMHGFMKRSMPDDVYRYGVLLSLSPVIFFILSIPVAFLNTAVAVATWFLAAPFALIASRWKPAAADEYF
jgi:uncharacterized membrane protein